MAASVAWAVGAAHDGTALPMGAGVASCAAIAAALAFAASRRGS